MMNLLFLVLFGFISLTAHAEDFTESGDHSASLSNLNYYPHQGRFLLSPRVTSTISDQNSAINGEATPTGVSTVSFFRGDLPVSYGLLPGLRLGISENELFHTESTHTVGNSKANSFSKSNGLSDPTFTTAYRYFEDDIRSGLSGDIVVSGSPSWVSHQISIPTQDGSNGKGYGTLSAAVPFYLWKSKNEVELAPAITHQYVGNGVGADPTSSFSRGSTTLETAALNDRVHFTPNASVQGGLLLNFPYNVQTTTLDSSMTVRTTQLPLYVMPRINFEYLFRSNVLFDVEYDYFNYTTSVVETLSSNKNIESTLALRFLIEI